MKRLPIFAAVCGMLSAHSSAPAQSFGPAGAYFVEGYVTSGLNNPTTMAFVDEDTVLIFEKGTGVVQRAVNGVVTNVAIDLPVNASSERGGLGICISPNFDVDHHVFLYYSHANVQGGAWTGNRVERFVYNTGPGTLTFDQSIITFAQDPAQSNGANHDGGIIMIGPDDKLYVITGDLNRGRFSNPRIEQNTGTTNAAAVGGIHRLNLDGSVPSDNPFFAHPNATIRSYWAYGIRNSFGMTFDPLTGFIWFSENGPLVYDEVNVVPTAGMNSGWLKLMGPDARNAVYGENGNTNYSAGQLTILTNSYYRDPEFSWLSTIAPTSMLVMNTPKVRASELNQMLVADNNTGSIYLFQMNPARDGFVLGGGVADKVADSNAERLLNVFGTSWGVTTDFDIGPDGYIYVVSLFGNRVNRIRPTLEHVGPNTLTHERGNVISGGLAELQASDNARLVMTPGIVFSISQAPISFEVATTSPFLNPVSFEFNVESQASTGSVRQYIEIERDDGTFEEVDATNMQTTDTDVVVTINTNTANYIRADGTITVRLSYRLVAPAFSFPWQARIDQTLWSIQR
ncbi:MAG: PQQ-dependent sugar dehydrogenase [Armatimonadota bacterium]|nr:PQQ-dependent sugar dehydrogenase [Armatimonadota bacterium]